MILSSIVTISCRRHAPRGTRDSKSQPSRLAVNDGDETAVTSRQVHLPRSGRRACMRDTRCPRALEPRGRTASSRPSLRLRATAPSHRSTALHKTHTRAWNLLDSWHTCSHVPKVCAHVESAASTRIVSSSRGSSRAARGRAPLRWILLPLEIQTGDPG